MIAGELHYPRIPHQYWRSRLQMARAMGLDAISTYVFWNVHERKPGEYDFEGQFDVAAFVRAAQEEGLSVLLRPGPYVCAEWDFGGLPAWLLKDGPIAVRTTVPAFFDPVRRWLKRLGEELAPLQRSRGGPIAAVQLENEYGAFGSDKAYLSALRDVLVESGFDAPMYTIDQPGDLARGALDDLPIAATFAPGDPGAQFEKLRALRGEAPLLCGEYWAGWFDHWGEAHARLDDEIQGEDLRWMLRSGVSLNIYMFHGGTNFGFWNGANAFDPHPYQPTITSYDYQAALDESGRPTSKYYAFRSIVAAHRGVQPPPMPHVPPLISCEPFALDRSWPLTSVLPRGIAAAQPLPMEAVDQGLGFILYRTTLAGPRRGLLEIDEVRDFAVVSLNGGAVARLDRRLGESSAAIDVPPGRSLLEILVENCGRINYGPRVPFEQKGITRAVRFGGEELRGFEMFSLPLETPAVGTGVNGRTPAPAFYSGTFDIEEPGDTFFDTARLGKGVLWVNGRNAGRFWNAGPQRALYVPGVWLRRGRNEAVALELLDMQEAPMLRSGTDAYGAPANHWA
jgi:beta-galactosidase